MKAHAIGYQNGARHAKPAVHENDFVTLRKAVVGIYCELVTDHEVALPNGDTWDVLVPPVGRGGVTKPRLSHVERPRERLRELDSRP